MKHTITYLNTDSLIPHPSNPRIITDAVEPVARSIDEFGFINPVIVNEHNVILAGHARVEAAKHLKLDKIPCINIKDLSSAQELAYLLADNKLSENASYDHEILCNVIKWIDDYDFDTTITGYSTDEIDAFISANQNYDQSIEDMLGLNDDSEPAPQNDLPEHTETNMNRVSFFFNDQQKQIVMDAIEQTKDQSSEKLSMGAALAIICASHN